MHEHLRLLLLHLQHLLLMHLLLLHMTLLLLLLLLVLLLHSARVHDHLLGRGMLHRLLLGKLYRWVLHRRRLILHLKGLMLEALKSSLGLLMLLLDPQLFRGEVPGHTARSHLGLHGGHGGAALLLLLIRCTG